MSYLDAFNRMDLSAVMGYFSGDALYEPGDGSRHVGREAIAQALKPQFDYAYGTMYFELEDLLLDTTKHAATLIWCCKIDANNMRFYSLRTWFMMMAGRLRFGEKAIYKGVDCLHFNDGGEITAKISYAQFGRLLVSRAPH